MPPYAPEGVGSKPKVLAYPWAERSIRQLRIAKRRRSILSEAAPQIHPLPIGRWDALLESANRACRINALLLAIWKGPATPVQFTNAIDIERRLSAEIREQGKSDPSALPDDNLAGILKRVNVLKSDLRTLGPMRHISKGYRTVEASLDRVSSSIQSAGTFVFDDAFRPKSEFRQCADEQITVLREIRDTLKRKK